MLPKASHNAAEAGRSRLIAVLPYTVLHRYLRASKWIVSTAIQRVEDTLKWRREYGLYDDRMSAAHVEPEVSVGTILTEYT